MMTCQSFLSIQDIWLMIDMQNNKCKSIISHENVLSPIIVKLACHQFDTRHYWVLNIYSKFQYYIIYIILLLSIVYCYTTIPTKQENE